MADEEKTNLRLEIAHVLFMDIVGYSRLLIDEQREAVRAGRARVSLRAAADPRQACAVISALLDESSESAQIVAKDALDLALMCRDPQLNDKALAADPKRSILLSTLPEIPHAFGTGLIANLRHDGAAAQEAFQQARAIQEKRVAAAPDDPGLEVELALIDAMLDTEQTRLPKARKPCRRLS